MQLLVKVIWVHPSLRNWLVKADVPFSMPEAKSRGFLRLDNEAMLVKANGRLMLCIGETVFVPVPQYAAYYVNTVTTKAGLAAKRREDKRISWKTAYQVKQNQGRSRVERIRRAYESWIETSQAGVV